MTEKPGIYVIRHLESGKVYVGSANNISKRWSRHRKDLRAGTHSNKHLQAAWTKYGEEAFVFEILELTNQLDVREQFWMDYTECINPEKGYNYCPIARSSRGVKRGPESEERRKKKSQYLKGKCGMGIASPVRLGTEAYGAKLTMEKARQIRALYGTHTRRGEGRSCDSISMQALAEQFGVTIATIYDVIVQKTWKEPIDNTCVAQTNGTLYSTKLTREQVEEIRHRYGLYAPRGIGRKPGQPTYEQLAKEYGVSYYVINKIVRGDYE
ncbi:MAG TPA: GIY-YIG nuclease family protein [Ktedonobacteraceae bacterium]|nr:GIY-YIG nuclease family protein [Ktedonobacteraceae bacterium]